MDDGLLGAAAYLAIFICFCSRTQINFTVAIDFTASNGECYHCPQ